MSDIEEEFWGKKGCRKKTDRQDPKKSDTGFKYFLTLLFCMAAFLWIGFQLSFIFPMGVTEARPEDPSQGTVSQPVDTDGKQVVLILGSDKRGDEASRSDTMMVAFLDSKNQTIKVLNIPRDTYVHIPSRGGKTKINHSYAFGGVDLTKATVEELLNVKIDHYVDTDFKGFSRMIDALGGINVDVEKRMYYPAENIDLQAGEQLLDGDQALAYVRYRSDGLGDIGRVERQQKFLPILADRILSLSTLWKIPKLVNIFQSSVETDYNMGQLLLLANKFKNVDTSKIETKMLPGDPQYIGGVSYWIARDDELSQLVDDFSRETVVAEEQQTEKELN